MISKIFRRFLFRIFRRFGPLVNQYSAGIFWNWNLPHIPPVIYTDWTFDSLIPSLWLCFHYCRSMPVHYKRYELQIPIQMNFSNSELDQCNESFHRPLSLNDCTGTHIHPYCLQKELENELIKNGSKFGEHVYKIFNLPVRCKYDIFIVLLTVLDTIPHKSSTDWINTGRRLI